MNNNIDHAKDNSMVTRIYSELIEAFTAPTPLSIILTLVILNIPLFILWQINDRPTLHQFFYPGCPKNHVPEYTCDPEANLIMHTIRGGTTSTWRLCYTWFNSILSHRSLGHFLLIEVALCFLAAIAPKFPTITALDCLTIILAVPLIDTMALYLFGVPRGAQFQGSGEIVWALMAAMAGPTRPGPKPGPMIWTMRTWMFLTIMFGSRVIGLPANLLQGGAIIAGRIFGECSVVGFGSVEEWGVCAANWVMNVDQ